MLTLTEAAELVGVTRQAVYLAIKIKKLKAHKNEHNRWMIDVEDIRRWQQNKYKHENKECNGQRVYDGQNTLTLRQATYFIDSQLYTSTPEQRIYYLARIGEIKSYKIGKQYVFKIEDLKNYIERINLFSGQQYLKENYIDKVNEK